MGQSWWDRFLGFLGFGPDDQDEEGEVAGPTAEAEPRRQRGRMAAPAAPGTNVVALTGARQPPSLKVLVVAPKAFEDVQAIADQLKGRRPIILNVEYVDKDMAQRILNFLHGAIYALGGETQKISSGIFFFAPPGVDVANMSRGLSGAAIGGGAFQPSELGGLSDVELSDLVGALRVPLEDGRGGVFLPAQEGRRAAGVHDPARGGSEWRR